MVLEVKLVASLGVGDSKRIQESCWWWGVNILSHDWGADYVRNSLCEINLRYTSTIHTLFSIYVILQREFIKIKKIRENVFLQSRGSCSY